MFKSRMGPRTRARRRQGAKSPFPSFNLYSDRVKQLPRSLLAAVHEILRLAVFVFPSRTLVRRPARPLDDIGVQCLRERACVCWTRALKIKSETGPAAVDREK